MKKILYFISPVLAVFGGFALGACLGEYIVTSTLNLVELIVGCSLLGVSIVCFVIMNIIGTKNVKHNRKTSEVVIDKVKQTDLENTIQSILKHNGYVLTPYNDEKVYQKGKGFWTARRYINYYFNQNKLIVEGWVSIGIGNKPNEEFPIDESFFIKAPKSQVQKVMNDIITIAKVN